MKLHYYPETDSLYIELKPEPGAETREVADGLVVDIRQQGQRWLASTSDQASTRLDLSTLEDSRFAPARDRSRPRGPGWQRDDGRSCPWYPSFP